MSEAYAGRSVDEVLPPAKLLTLGLQHVLVMYAGAVAVPLILGAALGLTKDQTAFLISADLLCCGISTCVQSIGVGPFGIRLPVVMAVSFAAVGPMIGMAHDPSLGITAIFGATIAAGVIGILIAPLVGRMLRFFPPLVTGIVITAIGLSIIQVGLNWAAGGVGNPEYGAPDLSRHVLRRAGVHPDDHPVRARLHGQYQRPARHLVRLRDRARGRAGQLPGPRRRAVV